MKFPRTGGGTYPGARRRCKCSRKSCQATHFQAPCEVTYNVGVDEEEKAFSVYEVVVETGGVTHTGERV